MKVGSVLKQQVSFDESDVDEKGADRSVAMKTEQKRTNENWSAAVDEEKGRGEVLSRYIYIYIYTFSAPKGDFNETRISTRVEHLCLVSEQSHSSQDRFVNLIFHPVFLPALSRVASSRLPTVFLVLVPRSPPRSHLLLASPDLSIFVLRFPGALPLSRSFSGSSCLVRVLSCSRPLSPSSPSLSLHLFSRTRSPDDSQTAGLYGVDLLNRLASGYTENKNALSNA